MTPNNSQRFEKQYAHELLKIAAQDLASARALAGVEKSRIENVFFLGQQALEKALKAVLCWNGQPVPFIHDIGILVTKISDGGGQPPFGYSLNSLTEYATIRRYLEGREQFSAKEVRQLLERIEEAVAWCRSQVGGVKPKS